MTNRLSTSATRDGATGRHSGLLRVAGRGVAGPSLGSWHIGRCAVWMAALVGLDVPSRLVREAVILASIQLPPATVEPVRDLMLMLGCGAQQSMLVQFFLCKNRKV